MLESYLALAVVEDRRQMRLEPKWTCADRGWPRLDDAALTCLHTHRTVQSLSGYYQGPLELVCSHLRHPLRHPMPSSAMARSRVSFASVSLCIPRGGRYPLVRGRWLVDTQEPA